MASEQDVAELRACVEQLDRSDKGREALKLIYDWFQYGSGLSLDAKNQSACLTLILAGLETAPMTVRDLMREKLAGAE